MKYLLLLLPIGIFAMQAPHIIEKSLLKDPAYVSLQKALHGRYPRIMKLPKSNPLRLKLEIAAFSFGKASPALARQQALHIYSRIRYGMRRHKTLSAEQIRMIYGNPSDLLEQAYPEIREIIAMPKQTRGTSS